MKGSKTKFRGKWGQLSISHRIPKEMLHYINKFSTLYLDRKK